MRYQSGDKLGGKLTYVGPAPQSPGKATRIEVKCDCGTQFTCQQSNVRTGNTTQCKACSIAARSSKQIKTWTHERQIFIRYQNVAKHRGLEFTLTQTELSAIIAQACHYCDIPASSNFTINGRSVAYNGIDRVDNNRGYHSDNVAPCCIWCNRAKGAKSVSSFIDWATRVAQHQQRKS